MKLSAPRLAACLLALLGNGCASRPPPAVEPAASQDCHAMFAHQDQAIRQAGLVDGGPRRIAGFPQLRVTRLLASLAESAAPGAAQRQWLEHLRQADLEARWLELSNLMAAPPRHRFWQRVEACSRQLTEADARSPTRLEALRLRAKVDDDYSGLARILGLYPLAVPFLRLGIGNFQDEVRAAYAAPLPPVTAPARLRLWEPAGGKEQTPRAWTHDALGLPSLPHRDWGPWFERFAPAFLIETRDHDDLPGQPVWGDKGRLEFASDRPSLYRWLSHTRYRGKILPQLNYLLWFAARPPRSRFDPYAGELDGLIWRVTLDADGRPLVYDSIHACGCYHYFFPAQTLPPPRQGFWQEPVMLPQVGLPAGRLVLRLDSGTHYLRRVLSRDALPPLPAERLQWHDYAALRSLPRPDGSRRSLFGQQGIIAGTQRAERYWLWPSGVPDPGAMRQAGRHATAFIGNRHFDDAFLLERLFPPP